MAEVIYDKHELKLEIQRQIISGREEITRTNDIGYTSWQVAERIVKAMEEKKNESSFKKWLDKFIKVR